MWAPVISFLLMVLQSLIAPLPAFVLTLTNGLLFGPLWGVVLSWGSAMVGAALCFGLSRLFGRRLMEKLVRPSALTWTDAFFANYGKRTILVARLLPWISFDLVSYGAGLTMMGFWGFWSMTGLGQLPATLFYSYLGHRAGRSLRAAFFILTSLFAGTLILPLLVPFFRRRFAAHH
ncbi:MAG: VTT domain-containing protein [Kofleriaceae bacterium]|nr:VTT domain-containing protein [Candidatus Methylomirabilis lanthanidiphila]